ncbi:DUF2480 family protein [Aureibacter tunicatorum]|uniref:DUF2480 family protein n=1 Tax=Aureibacter tunicatorum TaxID=866807 RepID=A0AAE3XHH9_9BACT|nr:DUF2480 family protein [Aureibacter tunicatorum]MDR6237786.1 hypothetical protein [Aureibacter tunicatorum]BDD02821.1 hypothetical protein AUTU_03040 [Aureibacter tunicatorum]
MSKQAEQGEIVNRVASSGLISIDLEEYYPKCPIVAYDIAPHLFMGIALKEMDFRKALGEEDWSQFEGKAVYLHCSVDAIIPTWAYMLLMTKLKPYAVKVLFGGEVDMRNALMLEAFDAIDFSEFQDKMIVIKGCGDLPVGEFAYVEFTNRLLPFAKSIMYGEPCSTVPVYKKPRKK